MFLLGGLTEFGPCLQSRFCNLFMPYLAQMNTVVDKASGMRDTCKFLWGGLGDLLMVTKSLLPLQICSFMMVLVLRAQQLAPYLSWGLSRLPKAKEFLFFLVKDQFLENQVVSFVRFLREQITWHHVSKCVERPLEETQKGKNQAHLNLQREQEKTGECSLVFDMSAMSLNQYFLRAEYI